MSNHLHKWTHATGSYPYRRRERTGATVTYDPRDPRPGKTRFLFLPRYVHQILSDMSDKPKGRLCELAFRVEIKSLIKA